MIENPQNGFVFLEKLTKKSENQAKNRKIRPFLQSAMAKSEEWAYIDKKESKMIKI
ncbi:hypothetical protein LJR030_005314 [Rhizobium sp. LjRoot30]|uniref:hypothetical protein n=1 Tax=Rhizobium sp. LjRoot30 TaxID=3342320 RepID=UPI003ECC19F3